MGFGKIVALVVLLACGFGSLASADSIPFTGQAAYANGNFNGDYFFSGPGLSLSQGTPDGPSQMGTCIVGSICNFSFSFNGSNGPFNFCGYCLGYDGGSLNGQNVQWLLTDITFHGSELLQASGANDFTVSVPLTFSGTIEGYQLTNCQGVDCSLGPEVFALSVTGTGTGVYLMSGGTTIGSTVVIDGVDATLKGTASVVPEPITLTLTGTGLLGIWIRKKLALRV